MNLDFAIDGLIVCSEGLLAACSHITGNEWDGLLTVVPLPEEKGITRREKTMYGNTDCIQFGTSSVLVSSEDGHINLYTTELRHITRFGPHDDLAVALCELEPNINFASASWDSKVLVWDAKTQTPLATFSKHTDAVTALARSSETPNIFVSASRDQSVLIWDSRGTETHRIELGDALFAVALVGDVVFAGTEGGAIIARDFRKPTVPLSENHEHKRTVRRLVPNSDRSILASCGDDGIVAFSRISDGATVSSSKAHTDFVRAFAWKSPTSGFSAGWDKAIHPHSVAI